MKKNLPFVLFMSAAASLQMHGATATWDGSLNATWNADNGSDSNWTGGAGTFGKPLAADLLIFTGSANTTNTNDLANLTQFNGITFNSAAGSFVLGGNSITLGGNVANDSTNPQTINNALTYTAVRTFSPNAGSLTLGGVLSGGAASGLFKTGPGTLTLAGSGTTGNAGAGGIYPLDLRQGSLVISSGAYVVTGEAAIGSNVAAGNVGNNVNLTMNGGSLNVTSWFSLARGNGVGTVSSDVVLNNSAAITTANLGGGYNNNSTLNLPKGSLTLNNTSAFTVSNNGVNFNFGESPGSNVAITLNDSSTFTSQGGTAARSRIGQAGKGVFTVNSPTATAKFHGIQLGAGTGVGAFINKGNLSFNSAANIGTDILAVGQGAGYGYFRNDNGAATTPTVTAEEVGFGGSASNGGTGVVDIASGTFTTNSWFAMNRNQAAVAGDSQLNITGGTLKLANSATQNHVNWGIGASTQTSVINVIGGTLGSNGPLTDLSLQSGGAAAATSTLTIGTDGVVQVNSLNSETYFTADGTANPTGSSYVNFNGGTLKANAASNKLLSSTLTGVYIHAGGGTIDTNTFNSTFTEPLLSPTGNGLTAIPVTTAGAGYVGRPNVKITGGGGVGATAIASFDPATGAVTGVTITSPGSGYTSAPTVTLVGGGPTTAAVLGTVAIGPVTGGSLNKKGQGTLSVAAANTFTGNFTISEGKVAIAGAQASPVVVHATASLIVTDPVTPLAAATLTVPALTLDNGAIVEIEASSNPDNRWNDKVATTTPSTGLSLGTASIYLYDVGTTNKVFAQGAFNLFTYNTAFVGNVSGLTIANPVDGYTYTFSASAGVVKVTITFADQDGDGMPDLWETTNGLDPQDPDDANENADGDFSTNLEEYLAGTNPQQASSDPKNLDGDGLRDDWEISNFGTIAARDGTGDYDGDLATDLQEFIADSNPLDPNSWPDSDGDQMSDAWETRYFGSLGQNGTADTDGDGFSDLQEFQALTSPVDAAWTPTKSQLIHRWSFNGNLNDSISGVTGVDPSPATIVDPNGGADSAAVIQSATGVTLTGGASASSDYVKLGSNLLGSRTPGTTSTVHAPVSIELWATQISVGNWARIFDFGSSQNEYLFMSWSNANNADNNTAEWKDYETKTAGNTTPYTFNSEYHIVFTIEPAAGIDGKTKVTYYAAPTGAPDLGAPRGSFETTNNLTNLTDTICALGRSSFAGDAVAHASYNEARMWNGALPTTQRELLHDMGPDIADLTDSDGDGLVDAWEAKYFDTLPHNPNYLTVQNGTGDPDGDGYNNLAEQAGHSNPKLALSTPLDTDADGLADAWELTNFHGLTLQDGTGDPDGDLATNEEEETAATDPNNAASYPDTDGDLLKDAWEILYFGNIGARNGTLDYDGDGFTDKQEFDAGTNPKSVASKPASFVVLPTTGTDAASGIDSAKTYTHAIDFGATVTPVSVNGVAFHQASVPATGNDGTNNDFWNSTDTTGSRNSVFSLAKSVAQDWAQGNGNAANTGADGSMLELLTDFTNVSGNATQIPTGTNHTLTLGNLNPGTRYSTRLYYRPWTLSSNRNTIITFNGDGTNVTQSFNPDVAPTASAGYIQYDFTANDTDITIKFTINNDLGSGWHEYAVTNEVIPAAGDSDFDGIPDAWELIHFDNLDEDAQGDPDHDGTSNRAEYLLGMDPMDSNQSFRATKGAMTPGGSATLTWPAKAGLKFTVWRSTTLATGSWIQLGDPITTTGDLGQYTDNAAPLGKAFYRVQLMTP